MKFPVQARSGQVFPLVALQRDPGRSRSSMVKAIDVSLLVVVVVLAPALFAVAEGFIRMSAGCEAVEDLIEDMTQALDAIR